MTPKGIASGMGKRKARFGEGFKESLEGLSATEKRQAIKAIDFILENPQHRSLRTKTYQREKAQGFMLSSLNMRLRIVWRFSHDEQAVVFIAILDHDEM